MITYSKMTYIGGKGKLQNQHDIMIKYIRKGLYRFSKLWIQQLNEYLAFYKRVYIQHGKLLIWTIWMYKLSLKNV